MLNYDPKTHIQAGALRRLGWTLPDSIPDVASVPRWAVRFDGVEVQQDEDTQIFTFRVGATIVEPFRWLEGTYRVMPKCSICGAAGDDVRPDADGIEHYCDACGHKLAHECQGLLFRCHVNDYPALGQKVSLNLNFSFRLLKKRSCRDESCDLCRQFYEDLKRAGTDAIVWPEQPIDGSLYRAELHYVTGAAPDGEPFDDWEWTLELVTYE